MLLAVLTLYSLLTLTFRKILSGIPSEYQTDLIRIRPDILSGLIWVQSVCKGYEQTSLLYHRSLLTLNEPAHEILVFITAYAQSFRELSGSVVECLTRD